MPVDYSKFDNIDYGSSSEDERSPPEQVPKVNQSKPGPSKEDIESMIKSAVASAAAAKASGGGGAAVPEANSDSNSNISNQQQPQIIPSPAVTSKSQSGSDELNANDDQYESDDDCLPEMSSDQDFDQIYGRQYAMDNVTRNPKDVVSKETTEKEIWNILYPDSNTDAETQSGPMEVEGDNCNTAQQLSDSESNPNNCSSDQPPNKKIILISGMSYYSKMHYLLPAVLLKEFEKQNQSEPDSPDIDLVRFDYDAIRICEDELLQKLSDANSKSKLNQIIQHYRHKIFESKPMAIILCDPCIGVSEFSRYFGKDCREYVSTNSSGFLVVAGGSGNEVCRYLFNSDLNINWSLLPKWPIFEGVLCIPGPKGCKGFARIEAISKKSLCWKLETQTEKESDKLGGSVDEKLEVVDVPLITFYPTKRVVDGEFVTVKAKVTHDENDNKLLPSSRVAGVIRRYRKVSTSTSNDDKVTVTTVNTDSKLNPQSQTQSQSQKVTILGKVTYFTEFVESSDSDADDEVKKDSPFLCAKAIVELLMGEMKEIDAKSKKKNEGIDSMGKS